MVILVIFLIVAIVIAQLVGRMQTSLAAATAREREAIRLYEISAALAGLHDDHAIAQIITKQAQEVSQGEAVELNSTEMQPFVFRYGPLHTNTADLLRGQLKRQHGVVIIDVPYHVYEEDGEL